MRTVELLNPNDKEHAGFLFDLGQACQDELLDDYNNDLILMINQMQSALQTGQAKAFLCSAQGQKCGIIWVDLTPKDIGEIHAALMPKFREGLGKHALYFLGQFIPFCFDSLGLRKLRAMIPIYLPRPERLLRHYGFKKAGLHPEETLKDGKPVKVVELWLTRTLYEGLKNGQQKK